MFGASKFISLPLLAEGAKHGEALRSKLLAGRLLEVSPLGWWIGGGWHDVFWICLCMLIQEVDSVLSPIEM